MLKMSGITSISLEEFCKLYSEALDCGDWITCDRLAEDYPEYVEPYLKKVGEWEDIDEENPDETETKNV